MYSKTRIDGKKDEGRHLERHSYRHKEKEEDIQLQGETESERGAQTLE